ncbi:MULTISPECIES: hypothetical protein [unclassified Treponema]|uniref:hypothetical protein n=1 Tax=unclassified Treponema TaxID=2638727 RepID=UPI0020A528C7|nr:MULTISPECIES: hypothetical protein [unclassified Treponema]UTC67898.1 hypothetical protein E4O06_04390 [Treponema sp. OMZ 789]UTC70619.1 hypothetical protein E4O01_04380 [Treponema sp. OMZ 790]UTC73332.1 hypothetical protein E4O02_04545 [Treponema sp. OMZ 791]
MTIADFVNEIMELFIKSASRPDDVLLVRDIFNKFSISQGSEKHLNFIKAVETLKSQGYISIEKRAAGLECLVLTTKGFESIKKVKRILCRSKIL